MKWMTQFRVVLSMDLLFSMHFAIVPASPGGHLGSEVEMIFRWFMPVFPKQV